MQNTITTTILGNTSSLKEEKRPAVATPKLRISSETFLHKEEKHNFRLFRKIAAFFSRLFSGSKRRPQIESLAQQKIIALADAATAKSVVKTQNASAASVKDGPAHDITRKIAEQQFMAMDVSQSTMN